MNSRRSYSIFVCFIYGLEEKNAKSEVNFAVCRLISKPRTLTRYTYTYKESEEYLVATSIGSFT